MGNKQRGKMKKRLLVSALAACMAFPASLPAQAAGTVHGKKVGCKDEKTFARIRDGYQREMKKEAGI